MPADLVALGFAVAGLVARLHGDTDIAGGLSNIRDGVKAFSKRPNYARVMKNAEEACRRQLELDRVVSNDGDIEAAALALAPLLQKATGQVDLVELASDSSRIRQWIHTNGGQQARATLLSEVSQVAFDAMLKASTTYVAEIALHNSSFTQKGLQRLLQQNSEILSTIRTLEINSRAPGGGTAFDTFTRAYVMRIREQLDFVDLPGIDLERTRTRYALTPAYTPLKLEDVTPHDERWRVDQVAVVDGKTYIFDAPQREVAYFGDSDISELSAPGRTSLIVGEPGSGKSTLLKWVAVELATRAILQPAGRPRIPILIKSGPGIYRRNA